MERHTSGGQRKRIPPQTVTGRTWFSMAVAIVCLTVIVLLPSTGQSQVMGTSYTLIPSVDYILWDEGLGLDDVTLYGGRLSVNFGQILTLQGFYLTNSSLKTDLSGIEIGDPPSQSLVDQELGLSHYGADLVLNLGRGTIVPFVRGGGGILHFNPDKGESFDQIALRAGAGTRFQIVPRLSGTIFVEDIMFRLNRLKLSAGGGDGLVSDPDADDLRHNFGVGIGLNMSLGGYTDQETELDRAIRSRYSSGIFGASVPIEPFVGKVEFDKDAGLDDVTMIGLRTGVDFGQHVGLRAYYWRGFENDFERDADVQSYGGEAQFNMNTGQGAVPYLLVGAGQLDFQSGYRDLQDQKRSDKGMLILGGGVGLTMGKYVRVNAAVRDYIFSEADADKVGSADELLHNWTYTAGLSFAFGGKGGYDKPVSRPVPPSPGIAATADGTVIVAEKPDGTREILDAGALPLPVRSFQGDRVVTLPVPTVGEIYVRYGQPGGVNIVSEPGAAPAPATEPEALRRIIREELAGAGLTPREEKAVPETPTSDLTDDERMELLERRLAARLDEKLDKRLAQDNKEPQTVVVLPDRQEPVVTTEPQGVKVVGQRSRKVFHTYAGINVDDPEQFVLGARLDLGPIKRGSGIHFVPELALGMFSEGSVMLAGNAQYTFAGLFGDVDLDPYVSGGLGLIRFGKGVDRDRTEGVINLAYGLTRHFGDFTGFVEHQGVDLFSLHRINFGIRWTR